MVVTKKEIYSSKKERIFYNTDKFIYFVFNNLPQNNEEMVLTIYNEESDSIVAYNISYYLLKKSYCNHNIPFFTVRLYELIPNNKTDYFYNYFIIKNDKVIFEGEFHIKRNLKYNSLGYNALCFFNNIGIYLETFA